MAELHLRALRPTLGLDVDSVNVCVCEALALVYISVLTLDQASLDFVSGSSTVIIIDAAGRRPALNFHLKTHERPEREASVTVDPELS